MDDILDTESWDWFEFHNFIMWFDSESQAREFMVQHTDSEYLGFIDGMQSYAVLVNSI